MGWRLKDLLALRRIYKLIFGDGDMMDKINALFKSRRFWVAVTGVVVIAAQDLIGLSQAQAEPIVAILIAWIVGDSLEKTR